MTIYSIRMVILYSKQARIVSTYHIRGLEQSLVAAQTLQKFKIPFGIDYRERGLHARGNSKSEIRGRSRHQKNTKVV